MNHGCRLSASILVAIALGLALSSCGEGNDKPPAPPPTVGYLTIRSTSVPLVSELPGRTSAFLTAEVRPQVSGIIQQRLFAEGSLVRKGQPLYRIDPSLYRAASGQAQANLASALANAEAAQARADRYRPLASDKAISQQDYTDAAASARQAQAAVAQTRAALATARINLRFTTVPAPVSGRIGRSLVTEGALATASQASPLAVIAVLDPIYVDIQQSASEVLRLRHAGNGALADHVDVRLILDNGQPYPLTGSLEFSEINVDPATGTVTLRARFANPQGLLLPGMFVRARLSRGVEAPVWLVPQTAISRNPRGEATLFVVDGNGKAALRTVKAERMAGSSWVVSGGVRDGDRVIIDGLANLKPGMKVDPVPASSAPGSSASPSGA